MAALISSRSVDCTGPSLFVVPLSLLRCEHKQVVVGCWRAKEGVEVYLDLNSERGGAGGMKDGHPGIIIHDQGILRKRFGTV